MFDEDQAKGQYDLNPADIIDEEDVEESAGDQTLRQLSQTMKKVASKKNLEKPSGEKNLEESSAVRSKKVQVQAPVADK